jgi:hypothetical protein
MMSIAKVGGSVRISNKEILRGGGIVPKLSKKGRGGEAVKGRNNGRLTDGCLGKREAVTARLESGWTRRR